MDLMATCVDVAGVVLPETFHNKKTVPLEGTSLRPAFADGPLPDRTICWEHYGNAGVRRGDWKLVRLHRKPWELYDLNSDPTEMIDLADKMPERVREMERLYRRWAQRCHVLNLQKK